MFSLNVSKVLNFFGFVEVLNSFGRNVERKLVVTFTTVNINCSWFTRLNISFGKKSFLSFSVNLSSSSREYVFSLVSDFSTVSMDTCEWTFYWKKELEESIGIPHSQILKIPSFSLSLSLSLLLIMICYVNEELKLFQRLLEMNAMFWWILLHQQTIKFFVSTEFSFTVIACNFHQFMEFIVTSSGTRSAN